MKTVIRFGQPIPSTAGNRRVDVVLATENPVDRWDTAGELYREIVDTKGMVARKQTIPLVDSMDRSTVSNVLGSVRNLRVDRYRLIGTAHFAKDEVAVDSYHKLVDGHLSDFAITIDPRAVQRIRAGRSAKFRGKTINGPAEIVKAWRPLTASLMAVGDDPDSTIQQAWRSYQGPIMHRTIQRVPTTGTQQIYLSR